MQRLPSYLLSALALLLATTASGQTRDSYGGAEPVKVDKARFCNGEGADNLVRVTKRSQPQLEPECGYMWADPSDSSSVRVKPEPAGEPAHLIEFDVVWVGDGERIRPTRGHRWKNQADPAAAKYEVILRDGFTAAVTDVDPPPGLQWRSPDDVTDNGLRPAPGYEWVSPDLSDIRVRRINP